MKIKFLNVATLVVLVIAIAGAWWYGTRHNATWTSITTFEQCAQLYPVMESYPEQCKTPDGRSFVRDISNDMQNLIQVSYPQPNAPVASPLTVTGQARGNFYFEASFPVKLLDANGAVLAQVPAQAQGEWMTEQFVPFKVSLNFKTPTTKTGTLVLQNDNPSGDPTKSKELRIPVQFTAGGSAKYGEAITLAIGDKVIFPDGLGVTLKSIADSRCKPGVQCIWAGELAPTLTLDEQASDPAHPLVTKEVVLGTVRNTPVIANGDTFILKSATETTATINVLRVKDITTGVIGTVKVGPTCPVEKNPPDPACADKPYSNAQLWFMQNGTYLNNHPLTDVDGKFKAAIEPGSYLMGVSSASGASLPSCDSQRVTITAGALTKVTFICDSGIR